MTVGQIIKAYRTEHGLSQDDMAERTGLSKSYISILERNRNPKTGEPPVASLKTIKLVAQAIGSDFDSIFSQLDSDLKIAIGEQLPEPSDFYSNLFPARFHQKPLVGNIACGTPILAEENITDYVDVPEHINCDFALKCRGRSMINLGVKEGDIVYIRSQPEVQNGQIAAVIVDGIEAEATLKKFYRYDNQIVLVPANDEDKPFVYIGEEMARVHVQGLAVGFTHVFEQ